MASIEPLGDRVVVQPKEAEEKTDSGLYIPESAQDKPQKGTVVAIGPGRVENGNEIEMTVEEGDEILYGKYAGTEVTLDGQEFLIMRETDIFGIINE